MTGAQMNDLKTAIFALAFALSLHPAVAAVNNNPTPGSGTNEGSFACMSWCEAHNKTAGSQGQCIRQCAVYWCRGNKCGYQEPATAQPRRPIPTKPVLHKPGPVTTSTTNQP